jgi:hypothetical protein
VRPAIPIIHNNDSYLFYVTDNWALVRIERFANNQNVVPDAMTLSELDFELQSRFERRLEREKKAGRAPIS